jgi:hypothetical protein
MRIDQRMTPVEAAIWWKRQAQHDEKAFAGRNDRGKDLGPELPAPPLKPRPMDVKRQYYHQGHFLG